MHRGYAGLFRHFFGEQRRDAQQSPVTKCSKVKRVVSVIAGKPRRLDGTASSYKINTRLAERPSGCVVWLGWSRLPGTNRVTIEHRWFGGPPGEPLPDLGQVVAKHAKANAEGVKLERPGIRRVALVRFEKVIDAADLLDRLFGPATD